MYPCCSTLEAVWQPDYTNDQKRNNFLYFPISNLIFFILKRDVVLPDTYLCSVLREYANVWVLGLGVSSVKKC